jgi:hypothetical protein
MKTNPYYMAKVVMVNPIGMTDRMVAETYWMDKADYDLRIGLLNLLLNT